MTQAIDQLREWQTWFKDPLNEEKFKKDYRIPFYLLESHSFEQVYILIYGRRYDPSLTESFNKKRAQLQKSNEIFMTYDRLKPNQELKDCLTVKLDKKGYKAIQIQPTLELGPVFADDWCLIRDKEKAIEVNDYLHKIRKDFLISRWGYWDNWGKFEKSGSIIGGERE